MRASPIQSDFSTGEISPRTYGRVDAERYKSALATCFNAHPIPEGGVARRSGTRFVAEVKDSSKATVLIPFEFSTDQAYMLEFGNGYVRFFANQGQVMSGGVPYEISSPFLSSDGLNLLRFRQSADTLYLVHPLFFPYKLMRFGNTNWAFESMQMLDGPYENINTNSQVTLTPAAVSGNNVTITVGPSQSVSGCANNGSGLVRVNVSNHGWSTGEIVNISGVVGTTEANRTWRITRVDNDHFDIPVSFVHAYVSGGTVRPAGPATHGLPSHFGANLHGDPIRIKHSGKWGWGIIVGSAPGSISVDIRSPFGATTASSSWRVGLFKGIGYTDDAGEFQDISPPTAIGFYEDRLCLAGSPLSPLHVDGSRTGDYENFAPTDVDGTVPSDAAISFGLNQNEMNKAQWLASDEKGLLVGSTGAETVVKGSTTTEALSATNVSAKTADNFGSSNVSPIKVGKNTLFVQRAGKKVGEIAYFFEIDGFKTTDLTVLAAHITSTGVKQLAYQREPLPIVWAVLNDGGLAGLSYSRDVDGLKCGWHRHQVSGVSDAQGTKAKVESVAVIPSPGGDRYDVWLLVQRRINGQTKRYIEFFERFFDDDVEQEDAFFVDCGLSYDGSPATNISGLGHLEGQTVSILGDGFVFPNQVVTGGAITLSRACSKVHVGLGYNSDIKLLPINAGSQDGTSVGKKRRINSFGIMLHRSLGVLYGMDFSDMFEIITREADDDIDTAPPLFSGELDDIAVESSHDTSNQLCFRQDKPLPMMILSVQPQQVTQDKG